MLKNKLNITSSSELKRVEERITKNNIIELWESGLLDYQKIGSFEQLRYIHERTFEDIYDFAGKIREVNLAKDNFQFANVQYLEESIEKVELMPQSNLKEIIDKYSEMNIVHPFREGNGRTTRLWLDSILKKELGKVVNWNEIDKEEYFSAIVKSHTNTEELEELIGNNLTDKIYDREVFFKGLDTSYWYEELNEYSTAEIYKSDNEEEYE